MERNHPVEGRLWPVAKRNRMVAEDQPCCNALAKEAEVQGNAPGTAGTESGSRAEAHAWEGCPAMCCLAQCFRVEREEAWEEGASTERQQCNSSVLDYSLIRWVGQCIGRQSRKCLRC